MCFGSSTLSTSLWSFILFHVFFFVVLLCFFVFFFLSVFSELGEFTGNDTDSYPCNWNPINFRTASKTQDTMAKQVSITTEFFLLHFFSCINFLKSHTFAPEEKRPNSKKFTFAVQLINNCCGTVWMLINNQMFPLTRQKKRLHKNRVYFPKDDFGILKWSR